MASSGSLFVISCDESIPRIDPSRYFNLSAKTTQAIKTAGGRTANAINGIYCADQTSRIGTVLIVQHTSCTISTGDVEANIRSDIQALKDAPQVRNDIHVLGYLLDTETSQLREVSLPRNAPDAEGRRRVLSQMEDFGPFWC